jgi:hypothetical protein
VKHRYILLALLCALVVVFVTANGAIAFAQSGSEVVAATALGTVDRLAPTDGMVRYRAVLNDGCCAFLLMTDANGSPVVRFFATPEAFEAAKIAAGIDSAQKPAGKRETASSMIDGGSTSTSSSTGLSPLSMGPGWHTVRAEGVIGSGIYAANDLQSMLTYYSDSGVSQGSWWANAIWWPNWTYDGSSSNAMYKAPDSSYYRYDCTQRFKVTSGGTTYRNSIQNTIRGYSGGSWGVVFAINIDSRLTNYWSYGYSNNNGWMY